MVSQTCEGCQDFTDLRVLVAKTSQTWECRLPRLHRLESADETRKNLSRPGGGRLALCRLHISCPLNRSLHCTALYCTALLCTMLHWTALHCTALHCTALHCTALHCTELHCTIRHFFLKFVGEGKGRQSVPSWLEPKSSSWACSVQLGDKVIIRAWLGSGLIRAWLGSGLIRAELGLGSE